MKRRVVCLFISVLLLLMACRVPEARGSGLPLFGQVVVIDPGHGGPDPGAARGELLEKDIVLDLAFKLRELLEGAGACVYLTREQDCDLADQNPELKGGRKRRDIRRRVELVNAWQPTALLSLHVNAFSSARWRGAQVFYAADDEEGQELAKHMQNAFREVLKNTGRVAAAGDYRVLNESQSPAVLLEVGFITNPEEAELLQDDNYRRQIAWAIFSGFSHWLEETGTEGRVSVFD